MASKVTAREKDVIRKMRLEGHSQQSISKAIKRDTKTVRQWIEKLGLPRILVDAGIKEKFNAKKVTCAFCGNTKWMKRSNARFCNDLCRNKYKKYRYNDKVKASVKRSDVPISVEELIKRNGDSCYICNETVVKGKDPYHELYPNVEHVIPISKGGTHTWDNVMLAHRKCNWEKGDKILFRKE